MTPGPGRRAPRLPQGEPSPRGQQRRQQHHAEEEPRAAGESRHHLPPEGAPPGTFAPPGPLRRVCSRRAAPPPGRERGRRRRPGRASAWGSEGAPGRPRGRAGRGRAPRRPPGPQPGVGVRAALPVSARDVSLPPGRGGPSRSGQVLAQQAAPFDLAASPPSVPATVAIAAPSEFLFGGFAARRSAFCSPVLRLLRGRLPGGRTEGDAGAHGSSRASRARAARQPDAGAFRSWANVYLCTKVGWLGEEGLEVTPPTLFQLPCWRWTPEKHLPLCTQFLQAFSEHFRSQAKVETGVRIATSGQKILPCRWVSPPFIPDKTVGPPTPSNETLAGILLCRG